MRRRYNDQYDDAYDPYGGPRRRRGGWTVIGTPFGMLGGGRRYGGGYGPGYGRGRGGGGGCGRDLGLLESGCCLAESLDGSCLVLTVLALPQLLLAFVRPAAGRTRAQGALLTLIRFYQEQISARRAKPVCRYTPSCSAYAAEAVRRHGALQGAWMAAGRLVRCRPGNAGGSDPVRPRAV